MKFEKKNMFFFLPCEEDSVVFVEKKVIIQEHAQVISIIVDL